MNIVWDFDGTILPMIPYDSEQTLLLYRLENEERSSLFRRLFIKALMYADMKGWLGHYFKPMYIRAVRGLEIEALDTVTEELARRISEDDVRTFRELYERGHELVLVSCGTLDLSRATFSKAGIDGYFRAIVANNFTVRDGRILSMEFRTLYPEDKLRVVKDMGYQPEDTVVVGDGPTDIPLLEWSKFPVVIDRKGSRVGRFTGRGYRIISSIRDIIPLVREFELDILKR